MTAATDPPSPVDPPRYAPARALPVRPYVPGVGPRPADAERVPSAPRRVDGSLHPDHLYACDLYNHGYFWEAHEEWEALWHHCPAGSSARLTVQALIQAAAAWLKERMGDPRNAARLKGLAIDKLRAAATDGPVILGLDVVAFAGELGRRTIGDPDAGWPLVHLAAADLRRASGPDGAPRQRGR